MSNKSLVRKKSPRIQNWQSLDYHPKCIISSMVKGIFTAVLLCNVFHIAPIIQRALSVTSYLVECAVATEPSLRPLSWRGGLWGGLNRTKAGRGAWPRRIRRRERLCIALQEYGTFMSELRTFLNRKTASCGHIIFLVCCYLLIYEIQGPQSGPSFSLSSPSSLSSPYLKA